MQGGILLKKERVPYVQKVFVNTLARYGALDELMKILDNETMIWDVQYEILEAFEQRIRAISRDQDLLRGLSNFLKYKGKNHRDQYIRAESIKLSQILGLDRSNAMVADNVGILDQHGMPLQLSAHPAGKVGILDRFGNIWKPNVQPRLYRENEAKASAKRLEDLLEGHFNNKRYLVEVNTELSGYGFQINSPLQGQEQVIIQINPNNLDRDRFLTAVGMEYREHNINYMPSSDEWFKLREQIWLDGKVEFAVRDVPWIQRTGIIVEDIYKDGVRLLIGLGKVRGSASYEAFYLNAYNTEVFTSEGIRMLPIPIQMEEKSERDVGRIMKAILRDERIKRIALTQPVKEVAAKFIHDIDPDTLRVGAFNTASIEGEGLERHYVGRGTDGLGTVALAKVELLKYRNKILSEARVGLIGLGGFGVALLGKLLTNIDGGIPKEIIIAVRNTDGKGVEVAKDKVKRIIDEYNKLHLNDPENQISHNRIEVVNLSEVDQKNEENPFKGIDILVDTTNVGMDDNKTPISNFDFIEKDMIVFSAVYRTSKDWSEDGQVHMEGENRVVPLLREAYKQGAVVHTGLADWVGHQWLQTVEDLKRNEGLTPRYKRRWNAKRWDRLGNRLKGKAIKWANQRGYFDAKEVFDHEGLQPQASPAMSNGGIDLTQIKSKTRLHKEGHGVQMQFDAAMIKRIQSQGFDGLEFKINSILPVTNIPLFLGINRG